MDVEVLVCHPSALLLTPGVDAAVTTDLELRIRVKVAYERGRRQRICCLARTSRSHFARSMNPG